LKFVEMFFWGFLFLLICFLFFMRLIGRRGI
jgi:hypothetical protein